MSQCDIDISGLREQVLANAVHAFPSIVKDHLSYHKTEIVKGLEIFDVVIVPNGRSLGGESAGFQAYLTYGDPTKRQVAFKAKQGSTIEEALLSLMQGTGEEFAQIIAGRPVLMAEQAYGEVNDVLRS